MCKSSVSSVTDYLIVNPDYNGETVKYAKALELRESGKNDKIRIIEYDDFMEALSHQGLIPTVETVELVTGVVCLTKKEPRKELTVKEDSPISLDCAKECKAYIKNLTIPTYYMKLTDGEASLLHSHVGGFPYWPKSKMHNYPKDKDGLKLGLIAQIRFDDIEQRCENDYFPKHGMLQFFGRCLRDEYVDDAIHNEKKNLKIVYWDKVIEDESQLLCMGDTPEVSPPVINSYGGFNVTINAKDVQTPKDYDYEPDIRYFILERLGLDLGKDAKKEFKRLTGISANGWLNNRPTIVECNSFLIRLGGTPAILNYSPEFSANHLALFTFESIGKPGNWQTLVGDCGFIQYYISKENLLNLNFNDFDFQIDMC